MRFFLILLLISTLNYTYGQNSSDSLIIKKKYFQAETQKVRGNYKEAIKTYTEVINTGQSKYLSYAYSGRGISKSKLKQYSESLLDFNKSIEINPKYYLSHSAKAWSLHKLKRSDDSINSAIESIKLNNSYPYSFYTLGLGYTKRKEFNKAEKAFDYAIKNLENPENKKYRNADLEHMYFFRGLIKASKLNKKETGCKDLIKAKELGHSKAEQLYNYHCKKK